MSRRAAPWSEVTIPIELQERQRSFSFRGEQSLTAEPLLQLLESEVERALASRLHNLGVELQVAAGGIKAHAAETEHLHAVFGLKPELHSLTPEHDDADLALIVLEGKIDVTGRRDAKIGNLAHHPRLVQLALEGAFDDLGELGDGEAGARLVGEERQVAFPFSFSHRDTIND